MAAKTHSPALQDLANEIRNNFVVRNSSDTIDMADIFNQLSFSLQYELASLLCRAEVCIC